MPLFIVQFSRMKFPKVSPGHCPVWGLTLCKAWFPKWWIPTLLWLSLCAPLCMGTRWVSLHTQTTQQLSLTWMVVYAGCWWRGGLPSPYCRDCEREERLHSVYIIKARHAHTRTRTHTHTHTHTKRPSHSEPALLCLRFCLCQPLEHSPAQTR